TAFPRPAHHPPQELRVSRKRSWVWQACSFAWKYDPNFGEFTSLRLADASRLKICPKPRHQRIAKIAEITTTRIRVSSRSLGASRGPRLGSRRPCFFFTHRRYQWRRCERTGCCDDLLLAGKSIGHDPLVYSTGPILIRLNHIDHRIGPTHTL